MSRLLLTVAVCTIAATAGAGVLFAAVIHVPADQPTLAAAVAVANDGDTILVSPGTYPANMQLAGKNLIIESTGGSGVTQLVGGVEPASLVFNTGVDATTRFAGFSISNDFDVLMRCIQGGSPEIVDCVFAHSDNAAVATLTMPSGATSTPVIRDCTFESLNAPVNIDAFSSVLIERCTFRDNTAGDLPPQFEASGIFFFGGEGVVRDCTFESHRGSAILVWGGDVDIEACTFGGNSTIVAGAAVHAKEGARVDIDHTVFVGNTAPDGAALWIETGAQVSISGSTLAGNVVESPGGAVVVSTEALTVDASIIAFNQASEPIDCGANAVAIACSDVFGNSGGDFVGCLAGQEGLNGNFSLDPLFCDLSSADVSLRAASPCLPENSAGCGLVGALPVGCEATPIEPATWGAVKGRFRD